MREEPVQREVVRTEAEHQVEAPFGPGVAGQFTGEGLGEAGLGERRGDDQVVHGLGRGAVVAADGEDEPGEDLALVHPALLQRDGGAAVADLVADREGVEREVEVGAPGGRRRGQYDVRVARGLVEVGVDADHEVEAVGECPVQAVPVGRREHRVARDDDERPDPVLPGCLDLLGERGDGQFALGLGVPGDPAAPAAQVEALPGRGGTRGAGGGGEREEGAAGAVEVAGEDVEYVDEPAGQGAVLDGAAADAPVDGRGGGGGQLQAIARMVSASRSQAPATASG